MISQSTPLLALPLAVSINVLLNPAVRFVFSAILNHPTLKAGRFGWIMNTDGGLPLMLPC